MPPIATKAATRSSAAVLRSSFAGFFAGCGAARLEAPLARSFSVISCFLFVSECDNGSSRAAWLAGQTPKMTPTMRLKPTATITVSGLKMKPQPP